MRITSHLLNANFKSAVNINSCQITAIIWYFDLNLHLLKLVKTTTPTFKSINCDINP